MRSLRIINWDKFENGEGYGIILVCLIFGILFVDLWLVFGSIYSIVFYVDSNLNVIFYWL